MNHWRSRSCAVLLISLLSVRIASGQSDTPLVNLARLSSTHVSASSVNGNRLLSDKYMGVLNLFDDGKGNRVKNTEYTCWLTSGQARHWVAVRFEKPVVIHSVVVEIQNNNRGPAELALEVAQLDDRLKRIVKDYDSRPITGFKTTYHLPQPAVNIDEITIVFPGPKMIEVSEIKVMGQAPDGMDLTPHTPLIVPCDYEVQGPHRLDVQRVIRGVNDERMIAIAESTYPPRADILKTAEKAHFKLDPLPQDEKLWWYSTFDDVKIPHAITTEAIEYYSSLILEYRKEDWQSDIEPSSKFSYSASAAFEKHYKHKDKDFYNVHVVHMDMRFSAIFASLAAVSFNKNRTVVLDWQGNVLAIFGDGWTSLVVS